MLRPLIVLRHNYILFGGLSSTSRQQEGGCMLDIVELHWQSSCKTERIKIAIRIPRNSGKTDEN